MQYQASFIPGFWYNCLIYLLNKCMLLTTTDVIQGAVIQSYLGIVTAEVVYGSNFLRDF